MSYGMFYVLSTINMVDSSRILHGAGYINPVTLSVLKLNLRLFLTYFISTLLLLAT